MGLNIKKEAAAIVGIVFLLLGVLFGMQIMTFIFGNLGPTQAGIPTSSANYNTSLGIQNNSLTAISTYSAGASSQMSIASIVIIILLLLAVFALFWKSFMSGGESNGRSSSGGFGGNFQ